MLDNNDTNCGCTTLSRWITLLTIRLHRPLLLLYHLHRLLCELYSLFIAIIIAHKQVPGTLLARQFNPSRTIACGALIWSIAATCQAAAHQKAGLYVCRLFVGIGEAMFGQAMAFHLSLWYTKRDLAKRVGLFISAGSLSGAFGGLIAFGVQHIKNTPIAQWRILFLIEGCPSVLLAICVALFMPSRPESSRLLNSEQKSLCIARLMAENSTDDRPGIDWNGVRRTFTDWKTYVVSVGYVSFFFLPSLPC